MLPIFYFEKSGFCYNFCGMADRWPIGVGHDARLPAVTEREPAMTGGRNLAGEEIELQAGAEGGIDGAAAANGL